MQPARSLRKDLFPHHPPSHLLYEPRRSVRDRASQHLIQTPPSRGPAMSRACPRPQLKKPVASWALKPDSHGAPSVTWGRTQALVEGKEPGCGAGCGGGGIPPCAAGLCSAYCPEEKQGRACHLSPRPGFCCFFWVLRAKSHKRPRPRAKRPAHISLTLIYVHQSGSCMSQLPLLFPLFARIGGLVGRRCMSSPSRVAWRSQAGCGRNCPRSLAGGQQFDQLLTR